MIIFLAAIKGSKEFFISGSHISMTTLQNNSKVSEQTTKSKQSKKTTIRTDAFEYIDSASIRCKLTDKEKEYIVSTIESQSFDVRDFYYTKDHTGNVLFIMKYTSLIKYVVDKIDYMTFRYGYDYVDFIVKRKGYEKPFIWRVYKSDYEGAGGFWQTNFNFMLKKVAMSQALRILFSDLFNINMYVSEEYNATNETNYLVNNSVGSSFQIDLKANVIKRDENDFLEIVNKKIRNIDSNNEIDNSLSNESLINHI